MVITEMAQRALLVTYGKLPLVARRWVVRVITPSYTVGAICVVERDDGAIALIQQRYRGRWGLPGGLLARREEPRDAARREVREEIGIDVELLGEPVVVVEPEARRVDVVFSARPVSDAPAGSLVPTSPEITAVEWFGPDDLPELQEETIAALEALGRREPPQR
jgi:8-oxo-dGTP diphosphatase